MLFPELGLEVGVILGVPLGMGGRGGGAPPSLGGRTGGSGGGVPGVGLGSGRLLPGLAIRKAKVDRVPPAKAISRRKRRRVVGLMGFLVSANSLLSYYFGVGLLLGSGLGSGLGVWGGRQIPPGTAGRGVGAGVGEVGSIGSPGKASLFFGVLRGLEVAVGCSLPA